MNPVAALKISPFPFTSLFILFYFFTYPVNPEVIFVESRSDVLVLSALHPGCVLICSIVAFRTVSTVTVVTILVCKGLHL